MKKTITILLVAFLMFALPACGKKTESSSKTNKSTTKQSETKSSTTSSSERSEKTDGNSKVLVAYFSCTGTTKSVAESISSEISSDLYEIKPKDPYTDADLDYSDDESRCSKENNDPSVRPAILGSVESMSDYDIVFIGYPIWWGEAPRIVSTFMESYDFSGKTVIPFCTSSSSGIGESGSKLEELTSGAKWLSGRRFDGGNSQSTIVSWVNGLKIGG